MKITDEIKIKLIQGVFDLIAIPSIETPSTNIKEPFGPHVASAFAYLRNLALSDGFAVDECDGYCLEISCGQGVEVMIAAHIDVVPASGWNEAFSPKLEGNCIYGRGAQDDKGPLMVCYYALKAARDAGKLNNIRVRLVVGGNEETGSKCLQYYFDNLKKADPDFAFTPDAVFPLIYGEKGICNIEIKQNVKLDNVIHLSGGTALNVVPEHAEAILNFPLDEKLIMDYCGQQEVKYELNNSKLTIIGKSAHGSTPELGVNALYHLINILAKVDPLMKKIADATCSLDGEKLGIFAKSLSLGNTSVNLGMGKYDGEKLSLKLNARYPETTSGKKIVEQIAAKLPDFQVDLLYDMPQLLFDLDSPLVKLLLDAYRKETNDMSPATFTGGGTYARRVKNCVAYGMIFPGEQELFHMKNEKVNVESLFDAFKVYYRALIDINEYVGNKR